MLENIETILQKECKLDKERPIIVGVSGGPDSLCLMEVLRQLGYKILVAHFDHQLRLESSRDAHAVEKTATKLMVASIIDGANVREYSENEGLSIEEAARNLRYHFMFNLARRQNAQAVAVGHTADDQVETVLMHFLRGSGLTGLRGMSYRSIIKSFDENIPVIRPLLDVWREETVLFCASNGLRPLHDTSNDSMNFTRNRVRHLLVPALESYNPKFREAVYRMALTLSSDYQLIMEATDNAWDECVNDAEQDFISINVECISRLSLGLQRNLIKRCMQLLHPAGDANYFTIERAVEFINGRAHPTRMDLKGGLRILRETDRVYICTQDASLPFNLWPQMLGDSPLEVEVPGQVSLSGGWKISSERWHLPALAHEQSIQNEDSFQVWLDADTLSGPLTVRPRAAGDHFEPFGMSGHSQKLSDFMVNEKIPQRARDRWPLLCAGERIIWVPGYRPADFCRLREESKNVLYFSVSRPGAQHQ